MKPAPFDYHLPGTIEEAVTLLTDLGDEEPKVLAGGQSLVPTMNVRLARPGHLVDLNRVAGLDGITREQDEWRIGAMTRHASVEDSPVLARELPLLPAVASWIGYRPIRNRGTVGGSLCHADPAAEWPLLARLLRAELDVRSSAGSRTVAADEFFEGVFTTALGDDEVLTAMRFAAPSEPWRWGFSEFARKVGDFAITAVGALLRLADGVVTDASLVVAGADSTPVRLVEAEAVLTGAAIDDEATAKEAAAAAGAAVDPMEDVHGSSAYRRHLVAVQVERALGHARPDHRGARDGTT
ncbi:MAG: FAD binding domain-containing protein [Acidimicrobiales bacterium]